MFQIIDKKNIAIICNTPMFVRVFLVHQIDSLSKLYNVSIFTNMQDNPNLLDIISDEVNIINIPIRREINLFYDLYVLFLLTILLRRKKYSLVHSANPKAGLLTAIAAWISGIPNRLHTFTGQAWVTEKGIKRWILRLLDRLISILNSQILVDSNSQKEFLVKEGVLKKDNALVLGNGSISGVNLRRFKPSKQARTDIRKKLNIPNHSVVFLFVGRLKKEKGVFELVKAFKNISRTNDNVFLLIVGPDENKLTNELTKILDSSLKYTKFIGLTKTPEIYMMASDIFVMPSYREGFGTSTIEAASCGIPAIGSNIYGLSDSIKDGETGVLVNVYSEKDLEKAMKKLLDNDILRIEMGNKAFINASENFSQDKLTLLLIHLYQRIIL